MATLSEALVEAALRLPGLERVADPLSHIVRQIYAAGGPAGQRSKDVLNGTWLGHPLHPVLTDVPIGAWTAALVLDLFGERRGANVAIGVGLLAAAGAAVTGVTDWLDSYGKPRRLGVVHAACNGTAVLLYASSFAARMRSTSSGVWRSRLGYAAVSLGALYGGALSLDLQIGVNHARAPILPDGEIDLAALSDVPDGGMRRFDAKGYPVLLVRRANEVFALAATCAHQGGPLDEGSLDGDVVICPWHGSRFCVSDGSIVQGPTTYPQPAFRTRVSGERILIALTT